MDFFSKVFSIWTVMSSDHSPWFSLTFMGCLVVAVIAALIVRHTARRGFFMREPAIRITLAILGFGGSIGLGVPAIVALNATAVIFPTMLLVFTIGVVCLLGGDRCHQY